MQQGIEPLLNWLRIKKVEPHFNSGVFVDLGCGQDLTLVNRVAPKMDKVYGLDIITQPRKFDNVEILYADFTKKLPLKAKLADNVTMLAVLEHLPSPEKVIREVYRILKPGGVLLVTVPSPKSEPVLEVLSRVGLVRDEMIDQHENYFNPTQLRRIARNAGFKAVEVSTWEFGFNTFMKAVK